MNLVISVSGGETSGRMLDRLLKSDLSMYESVSAVFANTSQENEETLIFVKKLAELCGIEIIWLEAVIHYNERKASTYRVVNFDTAKRNGEVFEDMIDKYGIPNKAYPHCTRELKNNPIRSWCIDNFEKNYKIAIGIRLDEKERKPKTNVYQTFYPLIDECITKDEVLDFWSKQTFRLKIENYRGNCKWCWKKSDTKLKIIARENPDVFNFPMRMEHEKGLCGHNIDGTKRVFFRGDKNTETILRDANDPKFDYINERIRIINDYNNSMFEGGCSESCEAFADQPR